MSNGFLGGSPLQVTRASKLVPNFARPVPKNGYAWWYVDGLSADGRHGLTIIAFIGSVFSPYYARARRRRPADPYDFCALNVALYGAGGHRWAMTERRKARTRIAADRFQIDRSAMTWSGGNLTITIDERTVPIPRPLRGEVTIKPRRLQSRIFELRRQGRHFWHPLAPNAAITVNLEQPDLSWSGHGYLDINFGAEPLEAGFRRWDWSRMSIGDTTTVLYDIEERDGPARIIAARFAADGSVAELPPPPRSDLPRTFWRVPRRTRSAQPVRVQATFEDTPFYARSLLASGENRAFHESLSLDRFRQPVVQMMLPFRMPRAFWQR